MSIDEKKTNSCYFYFCVCDWYQKAATAGSADAMNNIALLYEKGKGVEEDRTRAAEWYKTGDSARGTIK